VTGSNALQAGNRPSPILQNHPGIGKLRDPGIVSQGYGDCRRLIRPQMTDCDESMSLESPISNRCASVVGLQRICVIRFEHHNSAPLIELPSAEETALCYRLATA
jgi:hypothetical protein